MEKISGTFSFEWSVHEAWRNGAGFLHMTSRLVDRKKAQEIIERHGLEEVFRTNDGEIYDTKGKSFKSLFPYGLKDKYEEGLIEKIDRI